MLPRIKRLLSSVGTAAVLGVIPLALPGGVALANSESVEVHQVLTETIVVKSNGSSYHQVFAFPVSVQLHFKAHGGVQGRIKDWSVYFELVNEDDIFINLSAAGISKTYPWGQRPKSIDSIETLSAPAALWMHQVKAMCNELADDLRAEGMTNQTIFSEDRKFDLMVRPWLDVSYTDLSLDQAYGPPNFSADGEMVEVICQKWQGSQVQHAGSLAVQTPKVVDLGLSIVEKATMNGACRIRLDGWVTTDLKNAEISLQFENQQGKTSPLQTVNTGESRTATFSRWEDVPNNPEGLVRIVGDGFQSDWVSYDLDCVEGGPSGLVAQLPPKLTMAVVPHGEVMVHGRICPQTVKLVGVIEGRGDASGQALFFGRGYISPLRDYDVGHGEKALIGAEAELKWDNLPAPALPNAPFGQPRDFGFNATNEDGKVIAMLPKRLHFIECKLPAVNQALQPGIDGLKAEQLGPQHSGARKPAVVQSLPSLKAPAEQPPLQLQDRRPARKLRKMVPSN